MARLALILAIFTSATRVLYPKVCDVLGVQYVLFVGLVPLVPAVILGVGSLWRVRCFARSWPVVMCLLIVWAGLAYAEQSESHRGWLIAFYWSIGVPVSALIVENRCWWLCAKAYVLASALMMLLVIWFEYQTHGDTLYACMLRFGCLRSADGSTYLSNPNRVGGQLAIAAVLAFVLYLRHKYPRRKTGPNQSQNITIRPDGFSLGWTVLLSIGCILTASRGAFVAWFAGMGLLLVWARKMREPNKLRDLVALAAVLPITLLFVSVMTGFTPWHELHERFGKMDRVVKLSGRTEIWENAFQAWQSSPRYMILGAGPGVADELLGRFDVAAAADKYGTLRRNVHSSFIEWGLSYGLLGMIAGTLLMTVMYGKARQLDRRDGIVSRQAILLCVCLFAMTGVAHRWPGWLASTSLILAMLSEPPARVRGIR